MIKQIQIQKQNQNINPGFLYGTAWKEDHTADYVLNALQIGYRGIDTANQRKHYHEVGVGEALNMAYSQLGIKREDLFLQTKFTYARGQDHRKPYDQNAPLKTQVQQSFQSSLKHLNTNYLDSYILHGPSSAIGLLDADWETWGEFENIYKSGDVKYLGISNISYEQLVELYDKSEIKPTYVQNRCFSDTYWDKEIREFCLSKGILYQGFSLLTANMQFLNGKVQYPEGRNIPQFIFSDQLNEGQAGSLHPKIAAIVRETGKNIQQIIFRFSQQIGMLPITGTRSDFHMKANLEISDLILSSSQLQTLENIAFLN